MKDKATARPWTSGHEAGTRNARHPGIRSFAGGIYDRDGVNLGEFDDPQLAHEAVKAVNHYEEMRDAMRFYGYGTTEVVGHDAGEKARTLLSKLDKEGK